MQRGRSAHVFARDSRYSTLARCNKAHKAAQRKPQTLARIQLLGAEDLCHASHHKYRVQCSLMAGRRPCRRWSDCSSRFHYLGSRLFIVTVAYPIRATPNRCIIEPVVFGVVLEHRHGNYSLVFSSRRERGVSTPRICSARHSLTWGGLLLVISQR